MAVTQVLSATSEGSTIIAPSGIQEGDILVLAERGTNNEDPLGTAAPSGFTLVTTLRNAALTTGQAVSVKLADGTEGGTSLSGISADNRNRKCLYVFRSDPPATGIVTSSPNAEATNANPAAQNVAASGGDVPLVVIGAYGSSSAVNPRTFSTTKDGEINAGGGLDDLYLAYKIYNSSPANSSIDMDDEGNNNILQSFYIEIQVPSLSPAALSSAGSGTASFVGFGVTSGSASLAGSAAANFVGRAGAAGVFSMAGSAAASFVGASQQATALSAIGAGAASFVGDTDAVPGNIGDPVLYYEFDEGSGSAVANSGSAGSGYDLTITGTPSWQTGSIDGALRVSSTTDYADVNDVAAPFTGDHTLSIRVRCGDLPDTFDEWLLCTVGWSDPSGIFDALFSLRTTNDGQVLATARDSANSLVSVDSGSSRIDDGNWHTISYRYTAATALIELFIDGAEVNQTDGGGSGIFDFFGIPDPAGIRVGGFGETFDLDEFRVYDRALSDSEMTELHDFTGGGATISAALTAAGAGAAAFVGAAARHTALTAAGSGLASFLGSSASRATLAIAGTGAANFVGTSAVGAAGNVLIAGSGAANFASPQPEYASFVLNGVDEYLSRTLSTVSPGTTRFTYSIWAKSVAGAGILFQIINGAETSYLASTYDADDGNITAYQQASASWGENGGADFDGTSWQHFVIRYDSTQATGDNRLRFYLNGELLPDTTSDGLPTLNAAHILFSNGFSHDIGGIADVDQYHSGKLAFIDVIDGLSLDPDEFAFDNNGTWTRKVYEGSYGAYGFSLDGTDGFNDVSGNGQDFTGQNMTTGANLDPEDLPPYGEETDASLAEFAAAGSSTASFIGAWVVGGALSADGAGALEAVGATEASAALSAGGAAAASFVGDDGIAPAESGAMLLEGASTASFVGASTASAAVFAEGTSSLVAINPIDQDDDSVVLPVGGGGGGLIGRPPRRPKIRRTPRVYTIKIGEWPELPDPADEPSHEDPYDLPEPDAFMSPEEIDAGDDDDQDALDLILALVA